MEFWLESWIRMMVAKVLRDERGLGELLIILLVLFLIYLLATGRRVTVQ